MQVQPQQAAQPEPPVRCSLRRLSCGWGFTASLLTSVCCNSPQLVSLELGVGSGVSDGVLQTVAEQCPLLERVKLKLACVSDQGKRLGTRHYSATCHGIARALTERSYQHAKDAYSVYAC